MEAVVAQAAASVRERDGRKLAGALSTLLKDNAPLTAQVGAESFDPSGYCSNQLPEPYDELLAFRLCTVAACSRQDFVAAYGQQEAALGVFHRLFEEAGADWLVPALRVLDSDLRIIAQRADIQLRARQEKGDKLSEAARTLNRSFTITITDRAPLETSKKWGSLAVINELFKIYFKLNNLRLCTNLIRAVDGTGFPPFDDFPSAQKVTYKYFVGRLSVLNTNFRLVRAGPGSRAA